MLLKYIFSKSLHFQWLRAVANYITELFFKNRCLCNKFGLFPMLYTIIFFKPLPIQWIIFFLNHCICNLCLHNEFLLFQMFLQKYFLEMFASAMILCCFKYYSKLLYPFPLEKGCTKIFFQNCCICNEFVGSNFFPNLYICNEVQNAAVTC